MRSLGGRPEKSHRQNRRCWADEAGDVRTDCSPEVRELYCPGRGQDCESRGFEAKKNLKKEVHWVEGVWGKAAQSCGMSTVREKGGAESFGLASIWIGDKVCEGLLGNRWQGYRAFPVRLQKESEQDYSFLLENCPCSFCKLSEMRLTALIFCFLS